MKRLVKFSGVIVLALGLVSCGIITSSEANNNQGRVVQAAPERPIKVREEAPKRQLKEREVEPIDAKSFISFALTITVIISVLYLTLMFLI